MIEDFDLLGPVSKLRDTSRAFPEVSIVLSSRPFSHESTVKLTYTAEIEGGLSDELMVQGSDVLEIFVDSMIRQLQDKILHEMRLQSLIDEAAKKNLERAEAAEADLQAIRDYLAEPYNYPPGTLTEILYGKKNLASKEEV